MRYAASEKLEIIRTVETSHLRVRRTLDKIGIPKTTFYAWLDRYGAGGFEALEDRKPRPKRVWNRIPDEIRDKVIERALEQPELSPRKVAVAFTDAEKTFVSEASVYRILKAEGLVTSPAFITMKAAARSLTRQRRSTSSGRPTSPISRSSDGAGSTCRLCSTTSPDTSSPGSSARQWAQTTSPPRSIWPCRHRGSIGRRRSAATAPL